MIEKFVVYTSRIGVTRVEVSRETEDFVWFGDQKTAKKTRTRFVCDSFVQAKVTSLLILKMKRLNLLSQLKKVEADIKIMQNKTKARELYEGGSDTGDWYQKR